MLTAETVGPGEFHDNMFCLNFAVDCLPLIPLTITLSVEYLARHCGMVMPNSITVGGQGGRTGSSSLIVVE